MVPLERSSGNNPWRSSEVNEFNNWNDPNYNFRAAGCIVLIIVAAVTVAVVVSGLLPILGGH